MRFYTCGEILLDLILEPSETLSAVAGGSQVNMAMNLAKSGKQVTMIGILGKDGPAELILKRLKSSGVDTSLILPEAAYKTGLAFASIDHEGKAVFDIYKSEIPATAFQISTPVLDEQCVVSFGSLAALNPAWQSFLFPFITNARASGSLVFYDPNIRCGFSREQEVDTVIGNMQRAHIIRGSDEDFETVFGYSNIAEVAKKASLSDGQLLIITRGSKATEYFYKGNVITFPVPALSDIKSTVGAGDAFNAGFLAAWSNFNLSTKRLQDGIPAEILAILIGTGVSFARDVCQSSGNQISDAMAERTKSF